MQKSKVDESEVAQSCLTLCDPMDCSLPGSSCLWDFPGKYTGVGCHFLLQEIFPTQGLNQGLLHYRQTLYCLSHQGSLPRTTLISVLKVWHPWSPLSQGKTRGLVTLWYSSLLHKTNSCAMLRTYSWTTPSFPFLGFLFVALLVTKLCLTLCDPMDCSPPASSVHGILQARILEWVAMPFSRGSSWPRDWTHVFRIGSWVLYHWAICCVNSLRLFPIIDLKINKAQQ